jgi:hypothetical protein
MRLVRWAACRKRSDRQMVDRITAVLTSAKNSKPGSARSRTIVKKRSGAYVVARDEGSVTRIYWLHVVKSDPLKNFVAEPDLPRIVLETASADVAAFTDVAMTTGVAAIAEYALSMQLRPLRDALER